MGGGGKGCNVLNANVVIFNFILRCENLGFKLEKIWSIVFIFNLLSFTLWIFRLIITCFGIPKFSRSHRFL